MIGKTGESEAERCRDPGRELYTNIHPWLHPSPSLKLWPTFTVTEEKQAGSNSPRAHINLLLRIMIFYIFRL